MYFKCHHLLCALQKVTDTDWESNQNNQDWNKDYLKFNRHFYKQSFAITRMAMVRMRFGEFTSTVT